MTWISRAVKDRIFSVVLLIVFGTLSLTTVYTTRQTEKTVKNTDLIKQCTTPGTQCSRLSQAAAQQRTKEVKAASFCLIDTITNFPTQTLNSNRDKIIAYYNDCVTKNSK